MVDASCSYGVMSEVGGNSSCADVTVVNGETCDALLTIDVGEDAGCVMQATVTD